MESVHPGGIGGKCAQSAFIPVLAATPAAPPNRAKRLFSHHRPRLVTERTSGIDGGPRKRWRHDSSSFRNDKCGRWEQHALSGREGNHRKPDHKTGADDDHERCHTPCHSPFADNASFLPRQPGLIKRSDGRGGVDWLVSGGGRREGGQGSHAASLASLGGGGCPRQHTRGLSPGDAAARLG